jgi:hypothetical protein
MAAFDASCPPMHQSGFATRYIFSLLIAACIVNCPAILYCQAPPKVLSMIRPDYPEAVKEGGGITCEVFLLVSGEVGMVTAIRGDRRFESTAKSAISSWLFEPSSGIGLRRVLVSFTFYRTSYSGLKNQVVVELIPERGLAIRLGLPLVSPLKKSIGKAAGSVCEVHDVLLKGDIVPLGYGLVLPRPVCKRAKNRLFPHSNSYVMGGCVVQPENAAEVLYCRKCRQVEAHWLNAHARWDRNPSLP